MNHVKTVITNSKYVKGRYDVLDQSGMVIDFRFSKKSALKYAQKHEIRLYEIKAQQNNSKVSRK